MVSIDFLRRIARSTADAAREGRRIVLTALIAPPESTFAVF
jgi:hypothetical protein